MSSTEASSFDEGQSPVPEKALADARRIVDTLHEPLLVVGDDLRVRQGNPAFYDAFGVDPEATIGESLFEIGSNAFDHPALREALDTLLEQGEAFEAVEIDRVFEGFGRRVLRVNGRMLRGGEADSTGAARGPLLLAINDVTEERRLEEMLRRRTEKLERSNEDLEQFAYAASHDLQEPLRMVASYLRLLERRYSDDLDETAQEFIDYAVDGAERMKALINGLLHYSRVGRKEGQVEWIDLNEVLEDVRADLRREIEKLDARLEWESLPQAYGLRGQIRRVLQNLIENALTYRGHAPPEIVVSGEEVENQGVHVVVRDNGPGIPEEGREKIFQLFKQLDPHGEGREGSGIGLAICKKIVERHEGRMWVDAAPSDGASFHFTLQLPSNSEI